MKTDSNLPSRRDVLRGKFWPRPREEMAAIRSPATGTLTATTAAGPLARQAPRAFPVHRPPRAIAEDLFLRVCTRCGDCMTACPHQAIVPAPASFRGAAGSPIIDAARQACWLCPDQPCVTSCQPRALRADLPIHMGTAQVDVTTCLAYQHSFCTVCAEQCPVPGAIQLVDGRPAIQAEHCVGCGVCFYVCPAPDKAILLTPTKARPEPQP